MTAAVLACLSRQHAGAGHVRGVRQGGLGHALRVADDAAERDEVGRAGRALQVPPQPEMPGAEASADHRGEAADHGARDHAGMRAPARASWLPDP